MGDKQAEESYFHDGGIIFRKYARGQIRRKRGKILSRAEYAIGGLLETSNTPLGTGERHTTDVRMKTPFQHGNVCEDPERCSALEEKGGNPKESICPQCPVYAECQQRGYLSQFAALQRAKVQMLTIPQLFF